MNSVSDICLDKHSPWLAALILFVEGYISIGIEMLTLRQLLPFTGSSIIVTSLVIGIFLLFLAIGYQKGGKQSGNLSKQLSINFLFAAAWLGIGLSYIFMLFYFDYANALSHYQAFLPLTLYLFLILAPLIYLLGQTVPITMNLFHQKASTGEIGGLALSISTIGSFCGATLTTLLLLQYLGVAETIFINSIVLVLLAIYLTETFPAKILFTAIGITLLIFIYLFNIPFEKKLFSLTDNYANYQLFTYKNFHLKRDERILSINNSFSSYTNGQQKGFHYIEVIKRILFTDLKLHNADILAIGAGGFSLSAAGENSNHVTYIDIDKQLKTIAIPHFVNALNGKLVVDDARHYMHFNRKTYQAIIVDAFSNVHAIPSYLLTKEFFTDIKRSVITNGTVIFNIIANPQFADAYSKHIDNTIHDIFRNCVVMPMHFGNHYTNILYVCTIKNNENDNNIYSDNLNTASMDAAQGE